MGQDTKILIIDDEEQIRYALSVLFELQKWKPIAAADVEQGIKLFKSEEPDLVLIDYHMPKINGVRGVEMLRHISADIPIIVFTIDENQAVADAFLEAGASDFALKPIKAPDIVSRIRLHLQLIENRARKRHPQLAKGLGNGTMELVENYLARQKHPVTADEVAAGSGLAYQTVYRYLQYLVQSGRVEMNSAYGKIGRPKQSYKMIACKQE